MFRRKQEPDSLSVTMAAVEAASRQDVPAMIAAGEALGSLSAQDVFGSLGAFFTGIAPGITAEQDAIIKAELAGAHGPASVRAAVMDIGTALMIDRDGKAAGHAVVAHARCLVDQDGLWPGVIWETVEAAGRACGRIGVQFNWKTG